MSVTGLDNGIFPLTNSYPFIFPHLVFLLCLHRHNYLPSSKLNVANLNPTYIIHKTCMIKENYFLCYKQCSASNPSPCAEPRSQNILSTRRKEFWSQQQQHSLTLPRFHHTEQPPGCSYGSEVNNAWQGL